MKEIKWQKLLLCFLIPFTHLHFPTDLKLPPSPFLYQQCLFLAIYFPEKNQIQWKLCLLLCPWPNANLVLPTVYYEFVLKPLAPTWDIFCTIYSSLNQDRLGQQFGMALNTDTTKRESCKGQESLGSSKVVKEGYEETKNQEQGLENREKGWRGQQSAAEIQEPAKGIRKCKAFMTRGPTFWTLNIYFHFHFNFLRDKSEC